MSRYLREFVTQHPHANVRFEYLHPDRVREVIEDGTAELGIVSYPQETQSLRLIPWREEEMAIVCPPDHPLAGTGPAPLESLRGEPLVAFQQGLRIREEIDRAFQVRHIEVTTALEFDNIETIKQAIEVGTGVSILPLPTVSREIAAGTLAAVPLVGQPLWRPLGILCRRDAALGAVAEQFVALLLAHADDDRPWAASATLRQARD